MSISLNRAVVLLNFKIKTTLSNVYALSFLLLPLFMAIATPFLINLNTNVDASASTDVYVTLAQLTTLFNLGGAALTVPIIQMAEEKEKNTLRTLMVSSVTPLEYLISSLLPTFLFSFISQVLLLILTKASFTNAELFSYLVVSALTVFISCIIGMCLGLFAKDQLSASLMPMPLMLILMVLPMVSNNIESLKRIQSFIYTDIASIQLSNLVAGIGGSISIKQGVILFLEAAISVVIFILLYKRNGFEKD